MPPPDARKVAKEKRSPSRTRFPDLDYKSVSRVDPVTPVRIIIADTGELSAGVAVGDGEGKTGIRPVDLVVAANAPIPKGHPLERSELAAYVDGLVQKLLKQGKGVWFVPLDSRQRFSKFSVMPQIVSQDGEIHPLSYIVEKEKFRPRYVSVLRVEHAWPLSPEVWLVPEVESTLGQEALEKSQMVFKVQDGDAIDARWVALKVSSVVIASWRHHHGANTSQIDVG